MSSRLFGTDGVRGLANGLLTAQLATSLAVAAAQVLSDTSTGRRPKAVVGRDPRASGEFLQAAISAGLASAGVDVIDVGVVPTPAVAFLTDSMEADFGVMLSASHNAMPDNGIKFFARGGAKLPDHIEDQIEAHLNQARNLPTGANVGRITQDFELVNRYVDHLLDTIDVNLDGLTVVVDGANGAASIIGPEVLRRAGARVIAIHCEPNGFNINENCGSTHMDDIRHAVVEHEADLGIAHDGDADRCLAVDAQGNIVDGDQILAILARSRNGRGLLVNQTVVATVMSNLGFMIAMQELDIKVAVTAVGDRYVLEEMHRSGHTLGGEQSGHVVMHEFATTGDGVLTALHLMAEMARSGESLASLAAVMQRFPQVLINVPNVEKAYLEKPEVVSAVQHAKDELGQTGRVLLRPSGTEPLIRVMVEAGTEELARAVAQRLADVVLLHCTKFV